MSARAATHFPLFLVPSSYISPLTGTTTDPPLFSTDSDCMPKSPSISHGSSTMTATIDEKRSEQEANHRQSEKRHLRSRKLSLLYQPACLDPSPNSPQFCAPPFSVLFHDSSTDQEDSSYTISLLEPSSSFQKFQTLRHSFRLPRLTVPTFSCPSFFDSPSLWLTLYFALNLSLTLYNKSVLVHFPFPYTLTALHALCGSIGASIVLCLQSPTLPPISGTPPKASWSFFHRITPSLSAAESVVLILFSTLYTINIVVSNASLRLVTVPFHQVVRASTPFFTILFSLILFNKRCTKRKLVTLIPVVAGVGFATYGDYYYTAMGFFLTLLGTLLAALKTILTNTILVKKQASALPFSSDSTKLLTDDAAKPLPAPNSPKQSSFAAPKLSLSPLQLLYLLSPLAFIQTMLLAHFTGELHRVQLHLFNSSSLVPLEGASLNFRIWLVSNGILAFFLNVVSFYANRRVGPLAMSVSANVKQVLTILCAVVMFDLTITPANGLGILLTLIGGASYAAVEYREKQNGRRFR